MDAYQAIISKRDRREFDARPIADETLQRILQAGRMAGSSSNTQPCRLVVLTDREQIEKLSAAGRGGGTLKAAPLGVIVLLQKGARDFDTGRLAQNMMVAAWAEGVISCPVGFQDEALCRQVLGYPEDFATSIGVAFGYPVPAGLPGRESRKRLPLEEMVHTNHW